MTEQKINDETAELILDRFNGLVTRNVDPKQPLEALRLVLQGSLVWDFTMYPCPACTQNDKVCHRNIELNNDGGNYFYFECMDCGFSPNSGESPKEAYDNWKEMPCYKETWEPFIHYDTGKEDSDDIMPFSDTPERKY